MHSKNQVEALLERIESDTRLGTCARHHLIMALEWVLDAAISTSLGLEDWLNDEGCQ